MSQGAGEAKAPITIEVWSDVACPWCYLGKKRLARAVEASGADVDITWRSFQLDPTIPAGQRTPHAEALSKKFGVPQEQIAQMNQRLIDLGAAEGIDYHFDGYIQTNTRDAHRVLQFAQSRGLGDAMKERLMRAQFTDGALMDDADALAALAAEVGLDAAEVREVLASGAFGDVVDADIAEAAALGVRGVPFFVFNREFAVSGAQELGVFEQALAKAGAGAE